MSEKTENTIQALASQCEIAEFRRRWKIVELSPFGSAVRDDFGPDSDVDVLVTFTPDAPWSLLEQVEMQEELKDIFGREVHLVEEALLETRSENVQ